MLHNPRYAGTFFHGRTRWCRSRDGGITCKRLPPDQWHALLPQAHVGYITWDQYQRNQRALQQDAQACGRERRKGPPGEGPASLQRLVLRGFCGQRLTVRYHLRKAGPAPDYMCQKESIEHAERVCQCIAGSDIDAAIGTLLLETLTPVTLEVALAVQRELQQQLDEADRLWR